MSENVIRESSSDSNFSFRQSSGAKSAWEYERETGANKTGRDEAKGLVHQRDRDFERDLKLAAGPELLLS